ncbi:patatin-like phospholipase family protein [Ideonella livida]|uniref:Patatin-like phospholipase family protein n=1 Tax=Ideonella livida TaxID=2707176 RepID=A0A7C9TK37_9BURK|nr:patatin-like phospholipase family protein [Ideonella livida]NDY91045.1 patatin-like phospholipase family protein [Ideonella livida]
MPPLHVTPAPADAPLSLPLRRAWLALAVGTLALGACGSNPPAAPAAAPEPVAPPPPPPPLVAPPAPQPKLGIALGGGGAKGFAHVGVLKMLEASGFVPQFVSGTSAGSVVGALYASGLSAFQLQEQSFALDEGRVRDVTLFGAGGLVKGEKLRDYVNELVQQRPLDKLAKPFAAVATELDTGNRVIFRTGNTGQAVRASCSIPGVFQPVLISGKRYVDGGLVSPVPVDAARELGAELVVAVDISSKATDGRADSILGNINQTITIMGQKLGEQEMARADVVIRPRVGKMGPADFDQKHNALLEGERAAQAALPALREAVAAWQKRWQEQWLVNARRAAAAGATAPGVAAAASQAGAR